MGSSGSDAGREREGGGRGLWGHVNRLSNAHSAVNILIALLTRPFLVQLRKLQQIRQQQNILPVSAETADLRLHYPPTFSNFVKATDETNARYQSALKHFQSFAF